MKIKKKDLRRGLAQLPINYPDPDVQPEAVPGGVIDMDAELVQVELLCKRLAHNEVVVRDAALADVPRYLERLTTTLSEMESDFAEEIASVAAYFAAHPKANNPYRYDNIPLALFEYRQKAQQEEQRARRRKAVRELKERRKQERLAKQNYGRYGAAAVTADEEGEEDERSGSDSDGDGGAAGGAASNGEKNTHKSRYTEWMLTWCDAELIFLKLARGLHFCLWHSDKPLVQLDCAQRIADLIHCPVSTRAKVLFYGAMFRVLSREWPTIDRYRMDKYLALVRRMFYAWIVLVKTVGAEEEKGAAAATATTTTTTTTTTTSPKKKGKKAAGKRSRGAADDAADDDDNDAAAADDNATSALSAANSARDIAVRYIQRYCGAQRRPVLSRTLMEMFYILQVQIVPSTTSVGLTMHLSDVAFDELTKASLPIPLFATLAAGIPLYAMSQGNYVEKRVLDSFFPPLAGGVFTSRRAEQLLETLKKEQRRARLQDKKRSAGKAKGSVGLHLLNEEELVAEAERLAALDNDALLTEIGTCCRLYSVSRGTARAVRVMFTEAELVLDQARDPDAYKVLTRTAQRRRIEREIEEVDETRGKVRAAREARRGEKRVERRTAVDEKVKERKAAMLKSKKTAKDAAAVDDKELRKSIIEEERAEKLKKRTPRDTKRKKHYQLTKEELYGDADSEEEK